MPTPEESRQSAEWCVKLAERADDEIERKFLLHMADQWRRLANYKAKRGRNQELKNSN
jgi:hypothetical protein